MATIADYVVRLRASDIPSLLSLHLNGDAPPTMRFFQNPFGFDMVRIRHWLFVDRVRRVPLPTKASLCSFER